VTVLSRTTGALDAGRDRALPLGISARIWRPLDDVGAGLALDSMTPAGVPWYQPRAIVLQAVAMMATAADRTGAHVAG